MNSRDPSLRLRPWASLVLFLSAYSPLMLILVIKDFDPLHPSWLPQNPILSGGLLLMAFLSSWSVIRSVKEVSDGLTVTVTKAANKSGDMFSYTIPYMLSFMKIDLNDWQILASLLLFLGILFVMAYRTQTVFINPVLAIAGYMLIDCTFKRDNKETQAMVITKTPIDIGDAIHLERLSHYLYINVKADLGREGN
jgi:hypothetical protein